LGDEGKISKIKREEFFLSCYNFLINSSTSTLACLSIPLSVPIANSECKGITQPISPSEVVLFNII